MIKVAVDLHIHTALSPCSDNDMTPNNIANMAYLKGLDFIAVTDHNSVENYKAVAECAGKVGVIAIPGMEVETREEVHLVCLFPDIHQAMNMQEKVYAAMPYIENREEIFGAQVLMDSGDNIIGCLGQMLLTAADLGVEDVMSLVLHLGGVVIPAHVDREAYSIISNLGFIPQNLNIKYLELSKKCNISEFLSKNADIEEYSFIRSSDAHRLEDILERECFIEVEEKTIPCLLKVLKNG